MTTVSKPTGEVFPQSPKYPWTNSPSTRTPGGVNFSSSPILTLVSLILFVISDRYSTFYFSCYILLDKRLKFTLEILIFLIGVWIAIICVKLFRFFYVFIIIYFNAVKILLLPSPRWRKGCVTQSFNSFFFAEILAEVLNVEFLKSLRSDVFHGRRLFLHVHVPVSHFLVRGQSWSRRK